MTTSRPMTKSELDSWYGQHQCPCCASSDYKCGAVGSWSVQVQCSRCGMRMSVVRQSTDVRFLTGNVLWAPPGYVEPPLEWSTSYKRKWRLPSVAELLLFMALFMAVLGFAVNVVQGPMTKTVLFWVSVVTVPVFVALMMAFIVKNDFRGEDVKEANDD